MILHTGGCHMKINYLCNLGKILSVSMYSIYIFTVFSSFPVIDWTHGTGHSNSWWNERTRSHLQHLKRTLDISDLYTLAILDVGLDNSRHCFCLWSMIFGYMKSDIRIFVLSIPMCVQCTSHSLYLSHGSISIKFCCRELADVEITLCRMASLGPTEKNSDAMSHILPVRGNETVGLIVLHHGWTTTSLIFWIIFFTLKWHARVNTVRIKYKLVKPMHILTKMKLQHDLLCNQLLIDLSRRFEMRNEWVLNLDSSLRRFWTFQVKYILLTHRLYMFGSVEQFLRMSLLHRDELNQHRN